MDSSFALLDYVIMGCTMTFFASIGLYYRFSGGRQSTAEEYLLADRNMPMTPVAVSLMASFMSAIAILGGTAEYYSHGIMFALVNFSYFIVIPLTAYFYLPVYFGIQKISTYEYLGLRFGPKLRIICSLIYTLQQILYNGLVLFVPALTLEAVTGMNMMVSILVMGFVCTFYSSIGGVKAVVVADIFQTLLMYATVWSITGFAVAKVGGFGNVWDIAVEGGRTKIDLGIDPTMRHTLWNVVIGAIAVYLSQYASNHTQIQRALTMKDLKTAQNCLWLSAVFQITFSFSICMCGIAIYSVYHDCDPLLAGNIEAADEIMPYFVIDIMKSVPGMTGLFIAGVFSASLSTLSAGCNCLAAVTAGDYMPWIEKRFGFKSLTGPVALKVYAMVYGLVFLVMAFAAQLAEGILMANMSLYGVFGGPLLAVFTLGMFTTVAHETGTIIGLLCGVILTGIMSYGGPRPKTSLLPMSTEGCSTFNMSISNDTAFYNSSADVDDHEYFYMYRISYIWTATIGFLTVFTISYALSLVIKCQRPWENEKVASKTNEDYSEGLPDPILFTPFLASIVRRRNQSILINRKMKMELLPLNTKYN